MIFLQKIPSTDGDNIGVEACAAGVANGIQGDAVGATIPAHCIVLTLIHAVYAYADGKKTCLAKSSSTGVRQSQARCSEE